jgi:hypothetical protein
MHSYNGFVVWPHGKPNEDGSFSAFGAAFKMQQVVWTTGFFGRFEVIEDAERAGELLVRRWIDTRL